MTLLVVYALAAFWAWYVLARKRPPLVHVAADGLRRLPRGQELVACPWCLGFWITLVFVLGGDLLLDHWSWETPFRALAVAALVGIAGTLIPDEGEPT